MPNHANSTVKWHWEPEPASTHEIDFSPRYGFVCRYCRTDVGYYNNDSICRVSSQDERIRIDGGLPKHRIDFDDVVGFFCAYCLTQLSHELDDSPCLVPSPERLLLDLAANAAKIEQRERELERAEATTDWLPMDNTLEPAQEKCMACHGHHDWGDRCDGSYEDERNEEMR
jgi:hypothetical protein